MTREECIALLDRYANYNGMGIPNLTGCKEAMKRAVELLSAKPSEDLEEEINRWQGCEAFPEGTPIRPLPKAMKIVEDTARHFANWQKQQTPMPEDTVIFQKGIEEGKRLMLEDAVEGEIVELIPDRNYVKVERDAIGRALASFNEGDKVKIVIVPDKEEQK